MKVVVPMAGRGSRFATANVERPKPLIPVMGKSMLGWALKSIEKVSWSNIIFIALREHEDTFGVRKELVSLVKTPFELVLLDDVTEGQLCTVLAAKSFLQSDEDVLIISSDTWVVSDIGRHITEKKSDCAGLISVASLPGNQWSFAKTDQTGKVVQVAEKERIADHASTGLYYFSNAQLFVDRAEEMITKGEKTKNEFYVIPLYQKYIDKGEYIGISQAEAMYDMGTPESLSQSEAFFKRL